MKKLLNPLKLSIVAAFSFATLNVSAQCTTFAQSGKADEGMVAHQLYRDAVKANKLDDAYENWEKAYTIAPAANGKNYLHYADGRTILKHKFDKSTDEAEKKTLANRILDLYAGQIECYGEGKQKPFLLGRQAYDVFYYFQPYVDNMDDKLQKELAETVELAGNGIEDIILVPYATVVVNQFAKEKMTKDEARGVYDKLNAIADHNIANNAAVADRFKQAKAAMNGVFARIERNIFDCAYFVNKLEPAYRAAPDDMTVIENTIRELKRQGCDSSEPLLAELEGKYAAWAKSENARRVAEFEANNPASIAKKLYDEKDYDGAIAKYNEAIAAESDPSKQATHYFSIASIQGRKQKKYSAARATALKAAKLRSGWGRPYMLIGDLYATGARNCGNSWNQRLAILAAMDKWSYAKSIDSSVASDASSKISKYQSSKPEKQEGFMQGVKEGASVKVGCWIGETVKVRYQ